jgi:hypothetical protein
VLPTAYISVLFEKIPIFRIESLSERQLKALNIIDMTINVKTMVLAFKIPASSSDHLNNKRACRAIRAPTAKP